MTTAVAWMAPVCALIGICMAAYLGSWVLKQDPGPDKMNSISIKIQQGAKAVSYTHLDVYKRQPPRNAAMATLWLPWRRCAFRGNRLAIC